MVRNAPPEFPLTGLMDAQFVRPATPPISSFVKSITVTKINITPKMNAVFRSSAKIVAFKPPKNVYMITPTGMRNAEHRC